MEGIEKQVPGVLPASYPVFLPPHAALAFDDAAFDRFIQSDIGSKRDVEVTDAPAEESGTEVVTDPTDTESFAVVSDQASTTANIREALGDMDIDPPEAESGTPQQLRKTPGTAANAGPFMNALLQHGAAAPVTPNLENKMLTENGDVAIRSTKSPLVDLFFELEDVITGARARELLDAAWKVDPLVTLKIIFNGRSIHLGKSSRPILYRCAGWLAQNHPATLVSNLPWLARPVIEKKKVEKKEEGDMVIVEKQKDEDDATRFDVKHGVSHGYWKDMLNMLALYAMGKLDCLTDPREGLNIEPPVVKKRKMNDRKNNTAGSDSEIEAEATKEAKENEKDGPAEEAAPAEINFSERRRQTRNARHEQVVRLFNSDPVYRGLHLAIARLFAAQLKVDLAALDGTDTKAKKTITLCGKWAPSSQRFHDKHTFVVSTIAEILYPEARFIDALGNATGDDRRELHLRHARDAYRKDVARLRKHLEIVERDLSANTLANIKYDRVPSLAMSIYAEQFAARDPERFIEYIDNVMEGKKKISGAILLPSLLMKEVKELERPPQVLGKSGRGRGGSRGRSGSRQVSRKKRAFADAGESVKSQYRELRGKILDGQWKAIVQRIKDSGTLSSSIAVCDVSGSMESPVRPDGTTPLDSAIGLSLLVAEVTAPPFGGAFITFSETPTVQKVNLEESLLDKYDTLITSNWGMSTDFVAVFEKLILPMAVENKIKPEDMVRRVFVFSDMQFNMASGDVPQWGSDETPATDGPSRWSSSYERVKASFVKAGYEMPELVFWNLAGGRAGVTGGGDGDPTAPKPVEADEPGTAMVSGYSQAMLKVFLDGGGFDGEEEEEEAAKKDGDEEMVVAAKADQGEEETTGESAEKEKKKKDPLSTVMKAVSHKGYSMLKVVD